VTPCSSLLTLRIQFPCHSGALDEAAPPFVSAMLAADFPARGQRTVISPVGLRPPPRLLLQFPADAFACSPSLKSLYSAVSDRPVAICYDAFNATQSGRLARGRNGPASAAQRIWRISNS
jgi:hypothetical protein